MSLMCGAVTAESAEQKSKGWLLDAPSDEVRFELLQRYLRGFDQPMWEVGERYQGIYEALTVDNYDLAIYHWEKIKTTIENGYLKRPARQENAEQILLKSVWQEVRDGFSSRNSQTAWASFMTARAACMACHDAESVPFMNEQLMFDSLLPPESP